MVLVQCHNHNMTTSGMVTARWNTLKTLYFIPSELLIILWISIVHIVILVPMVVNAEDGSGDKLPLPIKAIMAGVS